MKQDLIRALVVATLLAPVPVYAVGTVAGTDIDNTAQVTYDVGGNTVTQSSNTLTITVAEILDVDVTLLSPQQPVQPADTNQELLFTVTNIGNGTETFTLAIDSLIPGDDFDPIPASPPIFFDTDSSGDLSAGDTPYNPGSNDPVLAPDASVNVFLVNDIPGTAIDGQIGRSQLTATAATGTGTPGTVFPGAGDGGVDALAGSSGGDDDDTGEYLVTSVQMTVVKSASVSDPFAGSEPVPGAQITYQIVVTVVGSGTATSAQFDDQIPVNTTYVPNSIALNAVSLTDAADGDDGVFVAAPTPTVSVTLGDVDALAGPQTITFSVVID